MDLVYHRHQQQNIPWHLIHKYFVSVMYSLSSDQFVLLWDNEWSDFFLACARQPCAMQGFHQLNLFPLFCLFEKHVWSVHFFILHYSQINQASCISQECCSVLCMKYNLIWFFLPHSGSVKCCDQHRYSKLFLLQHHLILYFIFCLISHWK